MLALVLVSFNHSPTPQIISSRSTENPCEDLCLCLRRCARTYWTRPPKVGVIDLILGSRLCVKDIVIKIKLKKLTYLLFTSEYVSF